MPLTDASIPSPDFGIQILDVFYGDHVRTGTYGEAVNHYRDLSTIESAFGLPHLNAAPAVTDVWQ